MIFITLLMKQLRKIKWSFLIILDKNKVYFQWTINLMNSNRFGITPRQWERSNTFQEHIHISFIEKPYTVYVQKIW